MLKKIMLIILLLVILAAGAYGASEYLGVNIPVVSDLIDQIQPATATTETETAVNDDAKLFEPAVVFDPDPNGFGFRNFTGRFKEGDLTIDEAQIMFGDEICTRIENDTCIPHPKIITWIDDMNEMMNTGGHCVGFTVASNQLHTELLSVSELGADITYNLERELPVLKTISQGYASYYASNVYTQEVKDKTPTEIINALLILDEPVDIGIFYPTYGENGHSVLGHNVVDQGDGIYHIVVYDSNRPGEDNIIVVDTDEDTWFYADAATSPDQPHADYQGDAETKSLSFIPLSAYNEPLACPADFAELCTASSEAQFSAVTTVGRGSALADTGSGQIGRDGSNLVNTVPGAQLLTVRGELYSRQQPILLIPSEESFTLQAQGDQADAVLSITVANPTYSVVIDGLVGQPGQIEQLSFDPVTQQVSFVSGGSQRPFIEFVFTQNGVVNSVQMIGLEFEAGQNLTVTADAANGDLQINTDDLASSEMTLIVTQLTPDGEAVFANPETAVSPGTTQALDLDSWDGSGSLTLLNDEDGDGTYESNTPLTNEPVANILATIDSAETIVKSLQSVAHYVDDTQADAVATTLPTLGYPGAELGEIYLQLPTLQPDDLGVTLTDLNLLPEEIGHFTMALRLGSDETTDLLNNIGLTDEEKTAVETTIADGEMVNEALEEWEFRNAPNADDLLPFLEEQGLTDDQVGVFVDQIKDDLPQQVEIALLPEQPTSTPVPISTNTPVPASTNTPVPPTNTPAPTVAVNLCDNVPSPTQADVMVRFVNANSSVAVLYWEDTDEQLIQYGSINPGEGVDQETFGGHNWIIQDSSGNTLLEYTASGAQTQCATIP